MNKHPILEPHNVSPQSWYLSMLLGAKLFPQSLVILRCLTGAPVVITSTCGIAVALGPASCISESVGWTTMPPGPMHELGSVLAQDLSLVFA